MEGGISKGVYSTEEDTVVEGKVVVTRIVVVTTKAVSVVLVKVVVGATTIDECTTPKSYCYY